MFGRNTVVPELVMDRDTTCDWLQAQRVFSMILRKMEFHVLCVLLNFVFSGPKNTTLSNSTKVSSVSSTPTSGVKSNATTTGIIIAPSSSIQRNHPRHSLVTESSELNNNIKVPEQGEEGKLRPIIIMDGLEMPDTNAKQVEEAKSKDEHPITTSNGIPLAGFAKNLNVTHVNVTEPIKAPSNNITSPHCWKAHYSRGVGTIPNRCTGGKVRQGLLCHQPCKPGYKGVGFMCWEDCPEGYHKRGITCRRMKPLRVIIRKRYKRGIGSHMVCPPEKENRAGLCYHKCREGYVGLASTCWASCTGGLPRNCGAYCSANVLSCAYGVFNMIYTTSDLVANVIAIVATAGTAIAARAAIKAGKKAMEEAVESVVSNMFKYAAFSHTNGIFDRFKLRLIEGIVYSAAAGEPFDWGSLDPSGAQAVLKAFRLPVCQL